MPFAMVFRVSSMTSGLPPALKLSSSSRFFSSACAHDRVFAERSAEPDTRLDADQPITIAFRRVLEDLPSFENAEIVASAVERIIPPARAAQGYATYQVAFALGFGAGGTAAGFLYDADPLLPFIATAALALPIAAIVSAVLYRASASFGSVA